MAPTLIDPPPTAPLDWPGHAGALTPEAIVREAAGLLDAVCGRLGAGADRDILIGGLGHCLERAALADPGSDRIRRALVRKSAGVAVRILGWARATAGVAEGPSADLLAFESLCAGHRWTDAVIEHLGPPGGDRIAMQLYNEWIHQLVILRDLALPFDDWIDRPLPLAGPGPHRGLRPFDPVRRQFRDEIASSLPPERALANFRAAIEVPDATPTPAPLTQARMLDNELLRVFLAVVRCGSFTGAALALGRTQAAVSMQIKRLEEIVQVRLIQRESRQFQLTAEGETLRDYARRLIDLNEAALIALTARRASGPVRLAASEICAAALLPQITLLLREHFPECWLDVHTIAPGSLDARIGAGEDDLVLDIVPRDSPGTTALRPIALRWFTALRGNPGQRTPIPVALPPRDTPIGARVIQALDQARLRWEPFLVSESFATIAACIRAGEAVGVLPMLGDLPRDPAIRPLGPGEGLPDPAPMDLALATPGEHVMPAAQKLRALLIAHA